MTMAKDIIPFLRRRHPNTRMSERWAVFEELRLGTGMDNRRVSKLDDGRYGFVPNHNNRAKGIDLWAMSVWRGDRYESVGYEIKVSRSDWLRELNNPDKRQAALRACNRFYFVAPDGIIKIEEVPEDCGLLVVVDDAVRTLKRAPKRDVSEPTWAFFASLCRRLCRDGGESLFDELVAVDEPVA